MPDSYYTSTAYNSAQPRTLPPPSRTLTRVQRSAHKYGVSGKGVQCREFYAADHVEAIEFLLNDKEEVAGALAQEERIEWESIKNAATKLRIFGAFALFFAFGGLVTMFVSPYNSVSDFLYTLLFFVLLPIALFFLCRLPIKRGWVTKKHNTYLSRRTGLVTLTWKGKRVSYPFDEFDAAIQHVVGAEAQVDQYLVLIHRYTGAFCRNPGYHQESWQVEMDWELIQQYMDIAKPLPDIPSFEIFRERDPITAEYDRQHKRPKDYWKNLPTKEAERRHDLSIKAAKKFPWGETREEALNTWHWQPSGYGEAVYGENVVPMTQTGSAV